MDFPYREVFSQAEATLLSYGSRHRPLEEIRSALARFKTVPQRFTDDEFFWKLTMIVFYSGFRAATVTERLPVIKRHFPDWRVVAGYGDEDVRRILDDPGMIRNKRKIFAVVENALAFKALIGEYGSFQTFIDGFRPNESFEQLLLLKRGLETRLSYLGGVTAYHFLTEIGLPVLKPDRVLCRIFHRLGLISDETDIQETIRQGRRFAEETRQPIRYIDIVFVAYGQVQSQEFGIDKGICLKNPRCQECGLTTYCHYPHKNSTQ